MGKVCYEGAGSFYEEEMEVKLLPSFALFQVVQLLMSTVSDLLVFYPFMAFSLDKKFTSVTLLWGNLIITIFGLDSFYFGIV